MTVREGFGGVAAKRSAGLLLYRRVAPGAEVLLGHMGGPFWARRDEGAWSVPKGEYEPPEEPLEAARREFTEELGLAVPDGDVADLGSGKQSGGKVVCLWALEADLDPDLVTPGTFTMEWPKGSGRTQRFPEMDRVRWFGLDAAHDKIVRGQRVFVERLRDLLQS